jgi:hypothetical protein
MDQILKENGVPKREIWIYSKIVKGDFDYILNLYVGSGLNI